MKPNNSNKLVILDGYTLNPGDLSFDKLNQLVSQNVTVYDRTPPELVIERIGDAEFILTNKTLITKDVLAATSLKYIGLLSTGVNVVDLEVARQKGIVITNVPAYSTDAVAQLTFALLLNACHHVADHSKGVHDGEWVKSKDFCYWNFPLIELKGKTIGLIGYGAIGQAVSKIATAFGINVIFYNRSQKSETENCKQVTLQDLLTNSDIISLHCPYTDETFEIINKTTISQMKDGVFLLNTSRGPLLNEQDVADALKSGKIGYLGVDVVVVEPMKADNPLLKAPNCCITPHIAWAPVETRQRLLDIVIQNLDGFLKGSPQNVVS